MEEEEDSIEDLPDNQKKRVSKEPEPYDVQYEQNEESKSDVNQKEETKRTDDRFAVPSLPIKSGGAKPGETAKTINHIKVNKDKDKVSEFPLKEPAWGGVPDDTLSVPYSLTILKDGIVKDNFKLVGKSRFTFGRLDDCDLTTEHPSCSRYHAVIQYCVEEKDIRKKGFYLYDMGSTHGTFLNKQKVKAKIYNRVRVGYQLKFGGSTRLYIVEGPEEDQEDEADLGEMREKKRLYEQHKAEKSSKTSSTCSKLNSKGSEKQDSASSSDDHEVTWGFREDAEDEGINLKELFERKKEYEVKDPKKTLKGFFEREGIEFEYEMSERGSGKSLVHVAQVRLPLDTDDGEDVVAEGTSSNKKEAVLVCATEACRLIQAYDSMRNKTREDQRVVKQRQLEANDFYDSDEDSFLDRTGNIEKKRLERKKRAGKQEKETVETHDTLKEKLTEKEKELSFNETKLNRSKAAKQQQEDGDSLDAYMSSMKHRLDKSTETQIKRKVFELKKEIEHLKRLVEKTKPALPALVVSDASLQLPTPPKVDNKITPTDKKVSSNKTSNNALVRSSVLKRVGNEDNNSTPGTQEDGGTCDATENNENITLNASPPKKKSKRVYGVPKKPQSFSNDEDFVGWTPPSNQTGDGRTHLNDKLGY